MEHSVSEEPVKAKPAKGIGERVWKRVARQFDSSGVEKQWDEAILRITRGSRPEYTEEQLEAVRLRWHLLARGIGVAASTVDIAIASVFTGIGVNTLVGIRRFSPIDPATTPKLFEHMAGGQSSEAQRKNNALRQIASGSPRFALAGATVAFRPARLGFSLAGKIAGVGGERITGIINAMTHRRGSDVVFYGTGSAR